MTTMTKWTVTCGACLSECEQAGREPASCGVCGSPFVRIVAHGEVVDRRLELVK
jgi:rRNA maturation endonuclease Nob1